MKSEKNGSAKVKATKKEAETPAKAIRRWSSQRKAEVVLRLLQGETVEAISREYAVEGYRLARWREQAVASMEAGLQERRGVPMRAQLDAALKRVGELSMDVEVLQERCRRGGVSPFVGRRSRP